MWILTDFLCFFSSGIFSIQVGSSRLGRGYLLHVDGHEIHDKYDFDMKSNDIAIIFLKYDLPNSREIAIIPLAKPNYFSALNHFCKYIVFFSNV